MVKDDIGAGSGNSPYRWRPLEWKYDGKGYVNERTVGVQQTAWTFVAVSRSWMPDALRGLFWFAPDDSSTAVRAPFYPAITKIPASFGDPIGQEPAAGVPYAVKADAYNMNMDSAFWVWNLVANMAYGERYCTMRLRVRAMQSCACTHSTHSTHSTVQHVTCTYSTQHARTRTHAQHSTRQLCSPRPPDVPYGRACR